jgi:hypothetical protein
MIWRPEQRRPHRGPCGKVKLSASQAERVLDDARRDRETRGRAYREEQRSYFCRRCDAWHVTKQPDRFAPPASPARRDDQNADEMPESAEMQNPPDSHA